MSDPEISKPVKLFIASRRIGHLATSNAKGVPHVIPICYAFNGENIYSALDLKEKRAAVLQLKRVRNILENAHVSLVIDDYSENWDSLAYVLIKGRAEILRSGDERNQAESLLSKKYTQYSQFLESGCTVLKIIPQRVTSWGKINAITKSTHVDQNHRSPV